MKLHLGGSLAWYLPGRPSSLEMPLAQPRLLSDLLRDLALPEGEVALIVVNGQLVSGLEIEIQADDEVRLYPPIGGGQENLSTLWKN